MFSRIEKFVDRIRPNLEKESDERDKRVREVVKKSINAQRSSEDAMFEAYRRAGIAIVKPSRVRRWEE